MVTACAPGATIEKLIAFPTASTLRVQTTINAADADVTLSGRITPAGGGVVLWEGNLQSPETTISDLKPKLWTPATPELYQLTMIARRGGREVESKSIRVGFRTFEIKNAQFQLNGKAIFLRGIAINPPGRTIPNDVGFSKKFALDYVRFVKSQNVNIIRLTEDSQEWFDACDEVGVMLFQGVYGSPPAKVGERFSTKQTPPTDISASVEAYKHIFETYAHHPSIVIYIMSNELPYTGDRGTAWHEFLSKVHPILAKWDPTRPFIGNAGYGQGHEGDINDIHRYWGWYYNSFLTYYNVRDPKLFGDYEKNQPLTFTECVGSFTGPNGAFNLVESKQLGAALGWCGWAEDQAKVANEHQCLVLKNALESFRRMRPINPRISGIMPFTILFDNWKGIRSFDQMKPKPAMRQMGISYQPVLMSWEMWTPQVYAGSDVQPIAHVINDADDFSDLQSATLQCSLTQAGGKVVRAVDVKLPVIKYYGTWSQCVKFSLPAELPTGSYQISGILVKAGDPKPISVGTVELFVAGREWTAAPVKPQKTVVLYDPTEKTAAALKRLSISFQPSSHLAALDPKDQILVIGEEGWGGPCESSPELLKNFVSKGGRILCLAQDPQKMRKDWLPAEVEFFAASANDTAYPPPHRPTRDQSNMNLQRADHPVLEGLSRERLTYWSDYTKWDQTRDGFPRIYPVTRGYKLLDPGALAKTAVLINYDRGLEGIALAEFFDGSGSVLLSGLDLVARAGLDPAADRMLRNLVVYTASRQPHEVHPRVTKPIQWGNYATQQGVLAGPLQGLLVNVEWTPPPTAPTTKPLTRAEGAWNTKPSDQYVPRGVRPLGPYGWSNGTSLRELNRESPNGSGFFWASIPPGKNRVTTKVQNPTAKDIVLTVAARDGVAGNPSNVPAHQTITVRTPLPPNATDVRVSYKADKDLVILETSFE